MNKKPSGQILFAVIAVLVFLMIITPPVVNWLTHETRSSVKWRKTTSAYNLAEAGVERGMWKLQVSTPIWTQAYTGTVINGYNFDTTYQDVSGGSYRIKFSSGPQTYQVTVQGEGRDPGNNETRAIQAVYLNQAFPGPILTGGSVGLSGAFEPHWGPVMAQGNITISGAAATKYFPRKFSRNVVSGTAGDPRDTNGLTPPNTDNLEWWSGYNVPDLPILDFATLKASASANGTLNYYNGFASSHTFTGYLGVGHSCNVAGTGVAHPNPHNTHFADSNHHPLSKNNLIWYWDGDVSFTGGADLSGHSNGLYGTVIVRGNMTVETEDNYSYTATLSPTVWQEYQKIDTAALNEYPGDNGFHQNRATFGLGSENWATGPAAAAYTDVGFRGFIYVGGNFTIVNGAKSDFAGAIWVVGNITNANASEFSLVFYDSSISAQVPVLNVTLSKVSWKETTPSTIAWP